MHRYRLMIGVLTVLVFGSAAQVHAAPLAPGVLKVIAIDRRPDETFSGPRPFLEIVRGIDNLPWQPSYSSPSQTLSQIARSSVFRRRVWNIEFAFKPLRMLYVDLPSEDGTIQRTLVWYLVYRVRNPGKHLNPVAKQDKWGHPLYPENELVNHTIRFFPRFVLESFDQKKAYNERILPAAVIKIEEIETGGKKLLNSIEVSDVPLEVDAPGDDPGVWGVVTWVGMDPRSNFLAIYAYGLTNAYQWTDDKSKFDPSQPLDSAKQFSRKSLQLNFWRQGDEIRPSQREFHHGFPSIDDVRGRRIRDLSDLLQLYRMQHPKDHQWLYLP